MDLVIRVVHRSAGVGAYPDLSLFQIASGLRYAFPRAMARLEKRVPDVIALHAGVAERPRISAYLSSPRRLAFSEEEFSVTMKSWMPGISTR